MDISIVFNALNALKVVIDNIRRLGPTREELKRKYRIIDTRVNVLFGNDNAGGDIGMHVKETLEDIKNIINDFNVSNYYPSSPEGTPLDIASKRLDVLINYIVMYMLENRISVGDEQFTQTVDNVPDDESISVLARERSRSISSISIFGGKNSKFFSAYYSEAENLKKEGKIEDAVEKYKKAAAEGDVRAMVTLGHMYRKELGVVKNEEEALRYFQKADSLHSPEAMVALGHMYYYGWGSDKDKTKDRLKAFDYFKSASERGHEKGMYNYAQMCYHGTGRYSNQNEAIKYYKKAADKGSVEAMFTLANIYSLKKGSGWRDKAYKYYKKAADNNHVNSIVRLGIMHSEGVYGRADHEGAREFFARAAKEGSSEAMFCLGKSLESINIDESKKWYLKAAEKGHGRAHSAYLKLDDVNNVDATSPPCELYRINVVIKDGAILFRFKIESFCKCERCKRWMFRDSITFNKTKEFSVPVGIYFNFRFDCVCGRTFDVDRVGYGGRVPKYSCSNGCFKIKISDYTTEH